MKRITRLYCLIFGLFLMSANLLSGQDLQAPGTSVIFPREVSMEYGGKNYKLEATGASTRKKLFVKVYGVASYIEDPSKLKGGDLYNNLLNSKSPKQLNLVWIRSVDEKKVHDGYKDTFAKIVQGDTLKNEINTFVNFFGAVKSNDQHTIRWLPDGTITVHYNGQEKGKIQNEAFAKTLWSIWFGPNSIVNRKDLVSEIK